MERPNKVADLRVGLRYGYLTIRSKGPPASGWMKNLTTWVCDCRCGKKGIVYHGRLMVRQGFSWSCGCLALAKKKQPERQVWHKMNARCRPGNEDSPRYYDRGIRVCARWRKSFDSFFADMGPRPSPRHEVDRINNDGHYEPANCRWATKKQQARNRRSNFVIEIGGTKKIAVEWSEQTGVPAGLIIKRIREGWEPRRAVFTKAGKWTRRSRTSQQTASV